MVFDGSNENKGTLVYKTGFCEALCRSTLSHKQELKEPRLISSLLDYNFWVSCTVSRHIRPALSPRVCAHSKESQGGANIYIFHAQGLPVALLGVGVHLCVKL